ncbi:MAG: DUF2284 domain-containing protein [Archaeoglobaceae archaeon]|nr:DUF2284 domain-containing protein [Archaeoglobaceae archaeon]MDW7989540.1 DUF2284 domain-containing protein [Archaeoglobaceae archaeon]
MKIVLQKEIKTEEIVVSPRPFWKCRSCQNYGKSPSCPPSVPNWKEFEELLKHYKRAILLKFAVEGDFESEKREIQKFLLEKEKEFMRKGYIFAIAFFPGNCSICEKCENPCRNPEKMRISLSALGVEFGKLLEINEKEMVLYGLILLE